MEIIKGIGLDIFKNKEYETISFSIDQGEIACICSDKDEKDILFDALTFNLKVKPKTLFYNNHYYSLFLRNDISEVLSSDIKVVDDVYSLFSYLSISENVVAPLLVNKKEIDYKLFDELFNELDIDYSKDYKGSLDELSRIKVEIIRALMSKPYVIILKDIDKNLSSIDLNNIRDFITKINNIYHTTIVIFTNNFDFSRIASKKIYFEMDGFVEFNEWKDSWAMLLKAKEEL